MSKKINPSWERVRSELHSPKGVEDLRRSLKDALVRKYAGMAENMWMYDFEKFPEFQDFLQMNRDDQPEKTIMLSADSRWFQFKGQWHFLPVTHEGGVNFYGNFRKWHPVPIGWNGAKGQNDVFDEVMKLNLDDSNSVRMCDSVFGRSDWDVINTAVSALVDDMLTINQLTLLAKSPYVFRVGPDNILDAKNFFLALAEDKPAIFTYSDTGEAVEAVTEQTPATIDTSLFDVYRHWENILLEQLGIPGSQKTEKRAQQTDDEINLGEDITYLRRHEKFRVRKLAIDRLNRMAGTNVTVISVIDSLQDDKEEAAEKEDEKNDDVQ